MKKLLLLALAFVSIANSYGQQVDKISAGFPLVSNEATSFFGTATTANKTTGLSDTSFLRTTFQENGPYANIVFDRAAPFDSGALYGINIAGFKGFAQLYKYSSINSAAPNDTTYNIIGFVSKWWGRVKATSAKTVTFNVWSRSGSKTLVAGRPKFYISGTPQANTGSLNTSC